MKLRAKQPLIYFASNNTHPKTKRISPISTKWVHWRKPNYTITIDLGKIGLYFDRWIYQDYYSRKVPKK